jgi:hypothetical protein
MLEIPNCLIPVLNGAIQEGLSRLDDKELIKFCKFAKDSSIVLVSVNNLTCGFDINEKNRHANTGSQGSKHTMNTNDDDSVNKTQADLADAYIEAALGRKMFLLSPYISGRGRDNSES